METKLDLGVRSWVTVDASVEEAFDTFTCAIQTWWPLESNSIHAAAGLGAPEELHLERWQGGRLYEQTGFDVVRWGTVRTWDPPTRLVIEWEADPEFPPTDLEVSFTPDGEGTRVEIEHRGWEMAAAWGLHEAAIFDVRARFTGKLGWDWVLEHFAVAAGA